MRKIFIGMLFICLDFNLDIETIRVGLIPDFVGYIILIYGLGEMALESFRFAKAKPFALGMAIYTGILYFIDLTGVWYTLELGGFILGLVSLAIMLYILYQIVMAVADIEQTQGKFLNANNLYTIWKVLAALSFIIYLLMFVPALGLLCIIATLVTAICFLVSFNKSKELYYS